MEAMIPQDNLEKMARIYGGILVLGSLADSPAAESGLRYGDILTRVNGVPTATLADFFRARALDPHCMSLELIRDGLDLSFTLNLDSRRRASLDEVRACLEPLTGNSGEKPPTLS
jgi:S1-C subfamily serine protease